MCRKRLITMSEKYQHISPTMEKLHWLPIRQHIEYKVLLLTYKVLNGLTPVYLSDLLQCRVDWEFRRDNTLHMVDPKINRVIFAGRAFCKAAPVPWNSIPPSLCISVIKHMTVLTDILLTNHPFKYKTTLEK